MNILVSLLDLLYTISLIVVPPSVFAFLMYWGMYIPYNLITARYEELVWLKAMVIYTFYTGSRNL